MTQQELPSDWKLSTLNEVARVQGGYAFESKKYKENGIPIVRISNVKSSGLEWTNVVYWDESSAKSLERFQLKANDVLISMTGEVGVTCVVRDCDVPALLNQRVGRLNIIDASLDSLFLSFATRSEAFLRQVQNLAHGAIQANVSASKIEGVLVPLPTLPEQ